MPLRCAVEAPDWQYIIFIICCDFWTVLMCLTYYKPENLSVCVMLPFLQIFFLKLEYLNYAYFFFFEKKERKEILFQKKQKAKSKYFTRMFNCYWQEYISFYYEHIFHKINKMSRNHGLSHSHCPTTLQKCSCLPLQMSSVVLSPLGFLFYFIWFF